LLSQLLPLWQKLTTVSSSLTAHVDEPSVWAFQHIVPSSFVKLDYVAVEKVGIRSAGQEGPREQKKVVRTA